MLPRFLSLRSAVPVSFSLLAGLCALGWSSRAEAVGKELVGAYTPASSVCPTPEEAAKKMSVPEGYEVRCFAHEPMVINPVAMTWDQRGRLWVVEGYEYPEGSKLKDIPFGGEAKDDKYHPVPDYCKGTPDPKHPVPMDRIVILEDTHNTGVADKRTVFLEGLNMGSAILCGDGGVYVGQQPHILHFKDTDGDDHADQWRVVLTGFGREDTHELVNSFTWGPDGWMYMTHGVFTNARVRLPGVPESKGFKYDAGIARCRPLTGEFEVFADGTSNPWGVDFDAKGNAFIEACVIEHLFHMAPGGIYQRQGGAPENPYAYELLPSIVKHKHFRAAYAGIQSYQGGVYPADTHGHLFIGNIHDNAIHEEVVTPVGASFKAEPRRDFLRANDGWFRPVSIQTGPDGQLWVMDWCDKYPCYQNAKANPEGVDREKGRIWRVVYTGKAGEKPAADHTRDEVEADYSKKTTPELVKLLTHSNNWVRRTSKRMLLDRIPAEPGKPHSVEVASLIQSVSALPPNVETLTLLTAYQSADETLQWVQGGDGLQKKLAAESWWKKPEMVQGALLPLAADPDPAVRQSVAASLRMAMTGKLTVGTSGKSTTEVWPVLSALIQSGVPADDHLLSFAIWQALEPQLAVDPAGVLHGLVETKVAEKPSALVDTLAYKLMRRLCDSRKPENLDLALAFLRQTQPHEATLVRAMEGLEKGQEAGVLRPGADMVAFFAALVKHENAAVQAHASQIAVLWGDAAATEKLTKMVLDPTTPAAERLQGLQTLRKVKSDAARAAVRKILEQSADGQ